MKTLNPNLAYCFIREFQNNCFYMPETIVLKISLFFSGWLLIVQVMNPYKC